jgi:flagellar biogenesis protein FliO
VIDVVLSREFLATIGLLIALLILVGGLIWLLDRKQNTSHFGKKASRGLFSGFWWQP